MPLNALQAADYRRDGYVVVKNLFSEEEIEIMLEAVERGKRVQERAGEMADAQGGTARIAIWHELGDDIWADVSTSPRLVNGVRILLGEDAAFFHGKVMLKEARTGGAWEWHQDYGYWYNEGFLLDHLLSAFVALDPCTRENGCLQVLRGSHRLGRLDHGQKGGQTGVEEARLKLVEDYFDHVYVELEPGSVLYFHCNLLHASAPNNSDRDRRVFISCYTAVDNPQLNPQGEPILRPSCPVAPEGAVLARG